jgi:hypothetical protein
MGYTKTVSVAVLMHITYLTELVLSQIVKTLGPMSDLDPYTKYMTIMPHQSWPDPNRSLA